jgi:protein-S-isoprenylcysteine O-methyltransferase Ste14
VNDRDPQAEPWEGRDDAAPAEKPFIRNPLSVELTPRLLLPLVAGIVVVLLGEPSAASLAAGLGLVAAGEGLRIWGAGHLYKTRELVTSGPYAWIRHPLYAGTLLVGSGFLMAASGTVAAVGLPLYLLFFFGYYLPYKTRKEDGRLERRHPDYKAYREAVPSIIPWRGRYDAQGAAPRRWSVAQLRDNDELGTALLVASVAIVFAVDLLA